MAGVRSSQDSISSMRRSIDSDESSDEKTIYENLMEIFPLMEDFMKNQGSMTRTSFAHQAPMSFTRAPARQVPQKRKLDQKPVWANCEDLSDQPEEVKLVTGPAAQDLQRDIEELSNRLRETELQSTSATKELQAALELKETHIVEMELMVRRLQKEVQRKEVVANSAQRELAEANDEIGRMLSIMHRAESSISLSNEKAASFAQELLGVKLELSALHSKAVDNDQILSQGLQNMFHGTSSNGEYRGQGQKQQNHKQRNHMDWYIRNRENMELASRAYQAAIIIARHTKEESSLALCAEMRFQLQGFLRHVDLFVDSQVAGPSFRRDQLE